MFVNCRRVLRPRLYPPSLQRPFRSLLYVGRAAAQPVRALSTSTGVNSASGSGGVPALIDLNRGHPKTEMIIADSLRPFLSAGNTSVPGTVQTTNAMRLAVTNFLRSMYGEPHFDFDRVRLVQSGARDAFELLIREFTKPNDAVVCDEYTYFHCMQLFARYSLQPIPVRSGATDSSFDLKWLDATLQQLSAAKTRVPLAYVMPSFSNPTSLSLDASARRALIGLGTKYRFGIVADEIFHHLRFSGKPDPSITHPVLFPQTSPPPAPAPKSSAANSDATVPFVLSISSLSKTIAAEFGRDWTLGWCVHGPTNSVAVTQRLDRALNSSLPAGAAGKPIPAVSDTPPIHNPALLQAFESGAVNDQVRTLCSVLGHRAAVFTEAFRAEVARLPASSPAAKGLTITPVDGGYFSWIQLPPGMTDTQVVPVAESRFGVRVAPGSKSYSGPVRPLASNYVRICFAIYSDAELIAGAKRLVAAVQACCVA